MGQIQTWWDRFQLGGADSNIVGQISTYWNVFQRGGADSNLMGHIPTWWDISQQSNIVGQFSTNGNVFQRGETYFKVVEVPMAITITKYSTFLGTNCRNLIP